MTNCPICHTQLHNSPCPACGYDPSRDYTHFPTCSPLPAGLPHRETELLHCVRCGGTHFGLRRSDARPVCLSCGLLRPASVMPPVALAAYHTVFLAPDSRACAIGDDKYGRCAVTAWSGLRSLDASYLHTVGLRRDGTAIATGYNGYNQCHVSHWTDLTAVAAGDWHTVGLRADGTVLAIGDNQHGQCDILHWTGIVSIAAHGFHTVGLRADGTVTAAGLNENGQCGVEAWTDIRAIAATLWAFALTAPSWPPESPAASATLGTGRTSLPSPRAISTAWDCAPTAPSWPWATTTRASAPYRAGRTSSPSPLAALPPWV